MSRESLIIRAAPQPIFTNRARQKVPRLISVATRPPGAGVHGDIVVDGGDWIAAFTYQDLAALAAAEVPARFNRVYVRCYDFDTGPEGGDWYSEADAEPTHDLWVRDASGRYWQLDNPEPFAEAGGAIGNGVFDNATAFNALMAYMAARWNGGRIRLRALVYATSELDNLPANVAFDGMGGGAICNGTAAIRDSAATRLLYIGTMGGTFARMLTEVNEQRRSGGGFNNLMLDGNDFRAAVGLDIRTWAAATMHGLTIYACSQDQLLTGVVDYALSAGTSATQYLLFINCLFLTTGTSAAYTGNVVARAVRLTGGTATWEGNTSFVYFIGCDFLTSLAIPIVLENSDNCHFIACRGKANYDALQFGAVCQSADQDTGTRANRARHHYFTGCQIDVWLRASQTGGLSCHSITVLLSRANGTNVPVIEEPANGSPRPTCWVQSSGNNSEDPALLINGATPYLWADDLGNAVWNGSFQNGDVNFTKATGWTIVSDSANARSGNHVAQATDVTGTARNLTSNNYSVVAAGDTVNAESYFKASGTTALSLRIAILWYDKDKVFLSQTLGTAITADQAYAKSTASGVAPASAAFYLIRILCSMTAGTAWADDIYATRVRA